MNNFGLAPTNTMASTSFDILAMDGIDDPLINVNTLATLDLEECYFASAVQFIKEMNQEMSDNKKILYKSISESTEQFVVLESFSDFFSKVNDIINKFIKFIKSLVQRFITQLHKIISDDKYITKHKKDFSEFKTADEFKFTGYEYTFSPNVPIATASLHFTKNFFEDLYDRTGPNITPNGVSSAINAMDLDDSCDLFRAEVLGCNAPISISDFSTELFKVFRNDSLDTDIINVDTVLVHRTLDRYCSFSKSKSQIESDQKRIERDYNEVKNQVREITRRNGDLNKTAFLNRFPQDMRNDNIDLDTNNQGFISGDLMVKLDMYTKAKVDQITEYSNIHTLALAAKMDALKESYKQDRALLYTALSKIQRTESKRKEV